jgi:hypothetical protein
VLTVLSQSRDTAGTRQTAEQRLALPAYVARVYHAGRSLRELAE